MAEPQQLVRRLLDTPNIELAVPRLPPEVLHRLIEHSGLEACADLVALATPRQLQRVFDLDLWRAPAPGADEALDAERFGEWVEALVQSGAEAAAAVLGAMEVDLVAGGLAEHIAVFDAAAIAPYTMLHGEEIAGRTFATDHVSEIGGFVVEGRRTAAWEAIVAVLGLLSDERPAFFHRVMRRVLALSSGAPEIDASHDLLGDRDQYRYDLGAAREARRDRQGYVPPAQARAFLQSARGVRLDAARPPADPVAAACLRVMSDDPIAETADTEAQPEGPLPDAPSPTAVADPVTTVVEILRDAGVMTPPRALLPAGPAEDARLALVRRLVAEHPSPQDELAFLANALLAGCAIQERAFTLTEAADAVLATCNLGLENWPAGWTDRDLVAAFQVGWTVLHRDAGRHAAQQVIHVLAEIECDDRDVQLSLQALRLQLMRHLRDEGEVWRARGALDAILMLDPLGWAVLRALVDECPVMHAALSAPGRRLRVDPDAFTFIATNSELATVRDWLASLAATLAG